MHLKPILNTSLPLQFRQIRLELAREPSHPEGDSSVGYIVIAPLAPDGRIDPESWKEHREACRVTDGACLLVHTLAVGRSTRGGRRCCSRR